MPLTLNQNLSVRDKFVRFIHPINLEILYRYRQFSSNHSFQESSKWLLEQCKLNVIIRKGQFVSSAPQLIISNHTTPLAGPILGSIVDRDDLYYVGLATAGRWGGEAMASRTIPLYLSQQPSPYVLVKLKNNIYHRLREGIDREEAQKRNTKSILQAARRLNEGVMLVVAPTGGSFFRTTDWKQGVGVLIKIVKNLDTQVCFVRISGGSKWHLLRLLNPYLFGRFINDQEVSIDIHPPIPLQEFQRAGNSAKEISEAVRRKYIQIFGHI